MVGKHSVQNAFQNVARQRFAGVVPRGEQHAIVRDPLKLAHVEHLDVAPFVSSAECFGPQRRIGSLAGQELPQVRLQIGNTEREPHLLRACGDSQAKRSARHSLGSQPVPGSAGVETDSRSAHSQHVSVGKMDGQLAASRAADSKVPVEPRAGRVTQFLTDMDLVASHFLHLHVAAGKIGIHRNRLR